MFKKGLAALMALVMVLAAFPISAFAITETSKPSDGSWSNSAPFALGSPSGNYRIPCMVTLNDGTIVVAADARWNAQMDGGGNDTVVARSTDGGVNWNYTFANYYGDNGNAFNKNSTAFCDSELATDGETVYMLSLFFPSGVAINGSSANAQPETASAFNSSGKLILRQGSSKDNNYYLGDFGSNGFANIYNNSGTQVTGYTVDREFGLYYYGTRQSCIFYQDAAYQTVKTSMLFFRSSTDKGATWSSPTLVPMQKATERFLGVGPGRGLVVDNPSGSGKRIIFSTYVYNGTENQRSSFIYTDDYGKTWSRSQDATDSSNFSASNIWSSENQIIELNDGTLRMFFRNGNNCICYVDWVWNASTKTYSRGQAVKTIQTNCSDCMISAVKYPYLVHGQEMILVSCPRTSGSRTQGCVYSFLLNEDNTIDYTQKYASYDSNNNGIGDPTYVAYEHWNYGGSGAFSYSCLSVLKNGNIAALYEGEGTHIKFTTLDAQRIITNPNHQEGKTINKPSETKDITLRVGQTVSFANKNTYVNNTFDNTVKVEADGSNVTLTGKEPGKSTVVVSNYSNGSTETSVQYNVTVEGKYRKLTLNIGNAATYYTAVNTYSATTSGIVNVSSVQSGSGYSTTFKGVKAGKTTVTVGKDLFDIEVVLDEKYDKINKLALELEAKLADTTGVYKNVKQAYEAYLTAREYYDSWKYGEYTNQMTDSTVTVDTTPVSETQLNNKIAAFETAMSKIQKVTPATLTQSAKYAAGKGVGWQGDYDNSGNLKYGDAGLTASTFDSNHYYKNVIYSTVGQNYSLSSNTAAAEAATANAAVIDDSRNSNCWINIMCYYQPTVFLYDGSDMCTTAIMKARSSATGWNKDGYMKLYGAYPSNGAVLKEYWHGFTHDTLSMTNSLWPRSVTTSDKNSGGKAYCNTGYSASTVHEVVSINPNGDYSTRATWSNQLYIDNSKLNLGSEYYQVFYPSWTFVYNRGGVTYNGSNAYTTTVQTSTANQSDSGYGRSKVTPLVVINFKQVANDFSLANFDIFSHDVYSADIKTLLGYMDSNADIVNPANSTYNYASNMVGAAKSYSDTVKTILNKVKTDASAIMAKSNTDYDSLRAEITNSPEKTNEKCYDLDVWQRYIDARKTAINAINNVTMTWGNDYPLSYATFGDIADIAQELKESREALVEGACHINFSFDSKSANNAKATYLCDKNHKEGIDNDGVADLSNAYNPLDAVYQTIDMNKYNAAGQAKLNAVKDDFDASTAAGATFTNDTHIDNDGAAQKFVDSKITALLTAINEANDKNNSFRTIFDIKITVDGADYSTAQAYYNEPQDYTYTPEAGKSIDKWVITTEDGKVTEIKSDATSINYAVMSNATINIVTTDGTVAAESVLITGQRNGKNFASTYVEKGTEITVKGSALLVDDNVIMTAPKIAFWSDAFAWEVNGKYYYSEQKFTAEGDCIVVPHYNLLNEYTVSLEDENAGTITTYDASHSSEYSVDQQGATVNPQFDQRMQLKAADNVTDFGAWALVTENGYEIVSYEREYNFYCEGNAIYRIIKSADVGSSLPAVRMRNGSMACADENSINGAFIKNPDSDGKYKITFISQLVQDKSITKYRIDDCGVVLSKTPIADVNDFEIGKSGVTKFSSASQTIAGQWQATVSSRTAMFDYLAARAYVTYSYEYSGSTITVTVYSDPVVVENAGSIN